MRIQKVWWVCGLAGLLFAFGCAKKTTGVVTPPETGAVTTPGEPAMMSPMLAGYHIDGLAAADMPAVRGAVTGVSGCKITNEDIATGTITVDVPDATAKADVQAALEALKHGGKAYVVTPAEPMGAGISPTPEQKDAAEKGAAGGKTGY